jgi:hypothetical protein
MPASDMQPEVSGWKDTVVELHPRSFVTEVTESPDDDPAPPRGGTPRPRPPPERSSQMEA